MKRALLPSRAFIRSAKRLVKRRPESEAELEAALPLLAEDAHHPSLRTHSASALTLCVDKMGLLSDKQIQYTPPCAIYGDAMARIDGMKSPPTLPPYAFASSRPGTASAAGDSASFPAGDAAPAHRLRPRAATRSKTMNRLALLLVPIIVLAVTQAASADSITAGPVSLYFPFAASGYAAVSFSADFVDGYHGDNPTGQSTGLYQPVSSSSPFTLTAVGVARSGTVSLHAGTLTYTPSPTFSGHDAFSYTVTSASGSSATGLVTLTDFATFSGSYFLDEQYSFTDQSGNGSEGFTYAILTLGAGGSATIRNTVPYFPATRGSFNEYGAFDGDFLSISSFQAAPPNIIGEFTNDAGFISINGQRITPPGARAGRYTALIGYPPAPGAEGIGWGVVKVSTSGLISMSGQWGDGTPLLATSAMLPGGNFTFCGPVGSESLGDGYFEDSPGVSDFGGIIAEPDPATLPIYLNIIGSRFVPAPPSGHLLAYSKPYGTAALTFQSGDLSQFVFGRALIAPGDVVGSASGSLLNLDFPPQGSLTHGSSVFGGGGGQFSGAFTDPVPRPIGSWVQDDQYAFATDTLTNTATSYNPVYPFFGQGGGVELMANPGGPAVAAVTNPGFESLSGSPSLSGWEVFTESAAPIQALGAGTSEYFPTAGAGYAQIVLNPPNFDDGSFDGALLFQNVDLTGVASLSFDGQIMGGAEDDNGYFSLAVMIDSTTVWQASQPGLYLNQTIALSNFNFDTGTHSLQFYASGVITSSAAVINVDNIQTFGPNYSQAGSITSTAITPAPFYRWGQLNAYTLLPPGTALSVDLLDANGNLLAANVAPNADLGGIPAVAFQGTLQLRANLSTTDPTQTPVLEYWSVSWQTAPPRPTPRTFRGVVFQKQNVAAGVFRTPAGAGAVILNPE